MTQFLYQNLVRRALFCLDPESAHHVAMTVLAKVSRTPALLSLLRHFFCEEKPVDVFGLRFPNPVGLAAGFDKDAVALPAWAALGFGFVELGTITAREQPGNPQPRLFRYPAAGAVINRMGFNNSGADAVAARLQQWQTSGLWPAVPVGLNIGKSRATPLEGAVEDYLESFEKLHRFADYMALNVSSPNTPGLRQLQERDALEQLLRAVQALNAGTGNPKPLLLKIAPDLAWEHIEEIISLAEAHQLAGLIATNTTLDHSSILPWGDQQGGLSGAPLMEASTKIVEFITRRTRIPVIAAGGIMTPADALRKIDAGASLVQIYTGYIYGGPALIGKMVRALR